MTARDPIPAGLSGTLRENITRLSDRARRERTGASITDRMANAITRFTGSMAFVLIHLVLYGGWIAINLGAVPAVSRFDPTFVVLAMEASVEAIFLSTFVLISQNRMAKASQREAELDLHITLLVEHELTRVAELLGRVATRLDVSIEAPDYGEVQRDVEPVQVMDALDAERRN